MANYANLIQQINASIKTNGANLITGQMLQTILDNMVASLGANYQYAGVATPATNPGTPDQNVFYLAATAGTYTNFGGLVVAEGEVAALKYNGAWTKDTTGAASLEKVSQLGQDVTTLKKIAETQNLVFGIDNYYLNDVGRILTNSAYHCTDYIPVNAGDIVTLTAYNGSPIIALGGFDAGKNFVGVLLSSGTKLNDVVTIPDGVSFVVACGKKLVEGNTVDASGTLYTKIDTNYIENKINESIIGALTESQNLVFSVDNKYISTRGSLVSNNAYHCTDFVQVNQGDEIVLSAYAGSPILVVAGYDAQQQFVNSLLGPGTYQNQSLTIGSGISYIRICGKKLVEGNTIDATATRLVKKYVTREEWESTNEENIDFVRFRKISNSQFYIDYCKGNKTISYQFTRYYKEFVNLEYLDENGNTQIKPVTVATNMWNNSGLFLGETRIAEGNTNFISSYVGYVGNGHGCEVLLYSSMQIDGKEIDFSNTNVITGHTFQFVVKSNMFVRDQNGGSEYLQNYPILDTNGEPVIMSQHNMVIRIDKTGLSVDNTQRILQDNIAFRECHGAMLEVDYGLFNRVWVNNDENTINQVGVSTFTPIDGSTIALRNVYVHGNKVIMYGGNFAITQEMDVIKPADMNPGIYFNDYSNSRLKAYFQPVPTSTRSGGQTPMEFNAGDIIRVQNKRIIDF